MANICLIDDDLACELLVENLRHRGHNVERIAVADEALKHAEQIVTADLVILDLIMPRSGSIPENSADGVRATGMLVFQRLRQLRKDLPVLVFTANQDPDIIDVIEKDQHAKYLSRWSSPKFRDFIRLVHEMLGVEIREVAIQSFIVHGHDDKAKLELKNYLQNRLHLPEPTILHEQPNIGRTLIEKFEDLSAPVDLAFVLLTPDDLTANPNSSDGEKRRARQNVILELGFFLGKLGRRSGRVFLLYKGPLELPSDLSGVVYLDIGKGVEAVGEQIRLEIDAMKKTAVD